MEICGILIMCALSAHGATEPWQAKDLNPVTFKTAPVHDPVVLVQDGQTNATICVMTAKPGPYSALAGALKELRSCIKESTGVELPVVYGEIKSPAIIIGDCEPAAKLGLEGKNMPPEGFAIKTAPDHVFIVGHQEEGGGGTAWGVYEFLERFAGARWYFPGEPGYYVPKTQRLVIPPVWLEDQPVFRKRASWPDMSIPRTGSGVSYSRLHRALRAGDSWPVGIVVHQTPLTKGKDYKKECPEIFQLRSDGKRDFSMLCYGNPKTLEKCLEAIAGHFDQKKPAYGISSNAISVSPNDANVACYCPDCRKLWDESAGRGSTSRVNGAASRILGTFVAKLGNEVKKRWPDKTIIFLPYLNYTRAPDGIEFPDNVEVQICGMPGLAMYKEPLIAQSEQENIDKWIKLTGRKVQNWHYSCWPANRTRAAYEYPHVIKEFYQRNRDKTIGTFINGEGPEWLRNHISLFCWMKLLWNPDFDVDAAIDAYCTNMYGPADKSIREMVQLQMDGWEKSRWPNAALNARAIYKISYPKKTVERMKQLLDEARKKAKDNDLILKRIEFYAVPFAAFFKEYADLTTGTPLLMQKAVENPVVDGKLDDAAWQRAQEVAFVHVGDKKPVLYPTTLKAVWTADGVTFGFRMSEPTPDRMERGIKGQDDSMAWWDDNVEIFLDVTGKNEGKFYQFIINPNCAIWDAKDGDVSWTTPGMKTAAFIGKDFWSLEVFMPYSAFPGAIKPGSGSGTIWQGNFTRHRVADRGLKARAEKPLPESRQEYLRLNATFGGPSANLSDFGPVNFVE